MIILARQLNSRESRAVYEFKCSATPQFTALSRQGGYAHILKGYFYTNLVGTHVGGVYRNEPRFEVRDKSPIHYGAVWLKVIDEPPKKVIGHYWTDRESAGEMELTDQQSQKFQTFQSAQAYYKQLPAAT